MAIRVPLAKLLEFLPLVFPVRGHGPIAAYETFDERAEKLLVERLVDDAPHRLAGSRLSVLRYTLRRWARAVLGERFRNFEVRREERGLARGGPYRALRHLGYVELAMMDAGLPLALNQPYLLALAPIALLVRRARLETGLWRQAYP